MRKPPPLRPGDVIGVVSPAAAVDESALRTWVELIEQAGFRVRLGTSVLGRHGYLAGPDQERADDLHAMLRDPEVKAVIASRGGYGSGRLLPLLEPAELCDHPKIVLGHSDVTFLLNDLVRRAGVVTFHGPMVANFARRPETAAAVLAFLGGDRSAWHQPGREIVQPGMAEGRLVGGNLSVLVATLGTPYVPDTRDAILFLEDVNEKPYRVDRMLTQLRQAGVFDAVSGVVFGEMVDCTAGDDERVTVRDVIAEAFARAPYPVAFGLASGHGDGLVTLPLGVRVRLAGERLTLLESPFSEPG